MTQEDPEIVALVEAARTGDRGAFDRLVDRVRHTIHRWAKRFTGDPDDAEDVTQIVLLKLHDQLRGYEAKSPLTTWLFRITKNVATDRYRLDTRRASLLAARTSEPEPIPTYDEADEEITTRLAAIVAQYFAALPSRQREVFELADLRGHSTAEIAARLGIEQSTVRVCLLRARRAIRMRMLANEQDLLEEYRQ
jgi:RNA polymerase sigma-70 factor (ECF subfamily)